jgi:Leucine-rich repeat (LRR) protein
MEILKNTIKSDKRKSIKEKHELFQFLLKDNEEDVRKYFIKLNKKESNYFIYFFGEITFEKERHKILLTLINSIIMKNSHKRIDMNDNELEFKDDSNYKKIIRALSKLPFDNLKDFIFRNCELSDENTKLLKNLITTNLENLDLSKNKLQELNHILSENIDNLTTLDLSNNNISSLSQFKDMKFNNLIDLNLSFNKISDMECLGDKTNFDKLENINLSNNKIQKLKSINIKSLKHLDLLKNEINEGIIDFMTNIKTFSNSLNLKFDIDSVLFQYENELNVEFTYKLGNKNLEEFFKELNLNQIKEVKVLKSDIFDQNASYNIVDKEIKFNNDKNYIALNIITKLEFEQIKLLELTNCNLIDKNAKQLEILFSSNLKNLNLSHNKIQDINIFTGNEKLNNLKQLNLSHNEISDVAGISNGKLSNLLDLDLSFNKIEAIDFIESNTNLDTLEKLNLSNNQIKQLLKINLKNIKYLNILDNELSDGINEFIESINSLSHKLILEKLSDSSFKCDYDGNLNTKFKYSLKDNKDITQFLKEFSFNGINELKLQGFDNNNIKFLSNESLEDIKELDLIENDLNIISIFDNIHFPEAKKIKLSKNDFKDDSLDNLKNFSSIKVKSITINLERINLKYENPELEINSSNFNILHDNMGEIDEIKVEEFPNNLDIFSYDSFSNKKLPPFKDIKVESLNVTFENQKYSCEMMFKPINVKASYKFDNIYFMKSDKILSEI